MFDVALRDRMGLVCQHGVHVLATASTLSTRRIVSSFDRLG